MVTQFVHLTIRCPRTVKADKLFHFIRQRPAHPVMPVAVVGLVQSGTGTQLTSAPEGRISFEMNSARKQLSLDARRQIRISSFSVRLVGCAQERGKPA